jgi:glycosyltransferase involved in cell wall biosynthesis
MTSSVRKQPQVSVIMTSFNAEKTIEEAIESILFQTLTDFEFIIVNDGSSDRTVEKIHNHKDNRIRLVEQRHLGRVPSLNHAVRLARGNYISNLDADDVALPERLKNQVLFLESRPELGLLGTFGIEMNEYTGEEKEIRLPVTNEDIRKAFAFYCPFIHSSVMIRRAVFARVGLYNENLAHSEDLDLWIRIALRYTVANLPKYLVKKRIHPDQSFKTIKEEVRFLNEARLGWQAARSLSLPFPIKIHTLLFYIYACTPEHVRENVKKIFPTKLMRSLAESRGGWRISSSDKH